MRALYTLLGLYIFLFVLAIAISFLVGYDR
jgi:hypothetical protein